MYLADEYTLEAVSIIVTIYYIGRRSESLRHARHGPGETRGAGAGAALALRGRGAVGVRDISQMLRQNYDAKISQIRVGIYRGRLRY